MCENVVKIGGQINNTCKHGPDHVKHVNFMGMCGFGHAYVMKLVESGEMAPNQCELCLIGWLCDEPIESCMNPESTMQWYHQCPKPASWWVENIKSMLINVYNIDIDEF